MTIATATPEQELLAREEVRYARRERRAARIVVGGRIAVLFVFLAAWQFTSGRLIERLFVSTPIEVAREFWRLIASGQLPYHIRFTLIEVLAGYVIGAVLGLAAAWAVSLSRPLYRIVQPFLLTAYAIPKIALGPLIIMWFGLGVTPKIVIAGIFVFFIVFMNTLAGIHAVSRDLINIARVMGASGYGLMTKIIFPSAVPHIVLALRITIPQAMVGAIIGEFLAGNRGVGFLINSASTQYNTAGVFAGILSLLLVVLAMDWCVSVLERRWVRWQVVHAP